MHVKACFPIDTIDVINNFAQSKITLLCSLKGDVIDGRVEKLQ